MPRSITAPSMSQLPKAARRINFGEKVFNRKAMRKYLNKQTYEALVDTIENGTPLTREVADGIASGMRQWALEHGADIIRTGSSP